MQGRGTSFGLDKPFNYDREGNTWIVIHIPTGEVMAGYPFATPEQEFWAEEDAKNKAMELNGLNKKIDPEILHAMDHES